MRTIDKKGCPPIPTFCAISILLSYVQYRVKQETKIEPIEVDTEIYRLQVKRKTQNTHTQMT